MASNRHWPSMFKSKPCTTHHQWQHDINPNPLLSSGCHRSSSYSPGGPGSDERTPEPKPRWNPKPEQIRILEAIFNSGMVNPPRDEIRKIRAQLQEFGQVGDANVFYWFQNRKSRSKSKHRNLYQTSKQQKKASPSSKFSATTTSSSSSSSEKSITADNINRTFSFGGSSNFFDRSSNSPTASVNQTYFQSNLIQEPFFFPVQEQNVNVSAAHHQLMNHHNQGFEFSEIPNLMNQLQDHHHHQPQHQQQSGDHEACHGLLFSELMINNNHHAKKLDDEETTMMMKFHHQQPLSFTNSISASQTSDVVPILTTTSMVVPSAIDLIQGVGVDESGVVTLGGGVGPAKYTVFINDVAVEVEAGPVNVREAFGEGAMLINSSSGQPVATDEWGVTLHSLEHGAFYYLI